MCKLKEIRHVFLRIAYNLNRLYNSKATNAPKICAMIYGIKSAVLILPNDAMTTETAGLICPPEIREAKRTDNANAAPIARGFPVATTTYTKNKVPRNSAKYFCMTILYDEMIFLCSKYH